MPALNALRSSTASGNAELTLTRCFLCGWEMRREFSLPYFATFRTQQAALSSANHSELTKCTCTSLSTLNICRQ